VADRQVAQQVEIQVRYAGYLGRQLEEIARRVKHELIEINKDFDYGQVCGLSTEALQKLAAARPVTVGQAARIPGITPAAISLLMVHLKKTRQQAA
jgi:tRNA uridine 5-carboxymethylaminomethyl modification enzyme